MAYKIALASSDGKVVNQHFGRTEKFVIVEIDGESSKYIETRENLPACNNFEHSEDSMSASINLIKDCKAVFVAKVGRGAYFKLEENGIKAYETPYFIEDVIKKVINSKVSLE